MEIPIIQDTMLHEIRAVKVILDFDLAKLYNLPNSVLQKAVQQNIRFFSPDLIFKLTEEEWCNAAKKYDSPPESVEDCIPPYAFSEECVSLLSGVFMSKGLFLSKT